MLSYPIWKALLLRNATVLLWPCERFVPFCACLLYLCCAFEATHFAEVLTLASIRNQATAVLAADKTHESHFSAWHLLLCY
jgi:hypothetical protein